MSKDKLIQEDKVVETMLSTLGDQDVPEALSQTVLLSIKNELAREKGRLSVGKIALAVLCGIGLTVLAVYLTGHRFSIHHPPPTHVYYCATIWGGLFTALFCWVFGRFKEAKYHLGKLASVSTISITLTLLAFYFCPLVQGRLLLEKSFLGQWVPSHLGPESYYFVLGLLYSVIPSFIAALMFGRGVRGHIFRNSIIFGIYLLLLIIPAIIMQQITLATGTITVLFLGLLSGALGGFLGGIKIIQLKPVKVPISS